jgi:hypothetical protein
METKMEQKNTSLDELSTKEASKFRDAVTTGQARVEDFPVINSEVHNNPGSGYVAIVKADGMATVHGFGGEPSKKNISIPSVSIDEEMNFLLSFSSTAGAVIPVSHEPHPAEIIERSFRNMVDNYALKNDKLFAGLDHENRKLRFDFCNFVKRDQGAMNWDEIDIQSLPAMDVLADRFENHIRSKIENTLQDLGWEEQNLVRGLLRDSDSISDLDKIYKALQLPYYGL